MDTEEQLTAKYGRSKFNSSYKDQFLQEISSCVRETDFLVNPQANEINYSHENVPQESEDIYHRRQSQIPKRPKLQTTNQKKSLIPTTIRHSKKGGKKSDFGASANINSDDNQNGHEKSSIVPLADDDLTHIFDFSASNVSNDDSSASPSPQKYRPQKIRSKSPGPMLTNNNKKQLNERKNVIRSKSPSSLRRKTKKTGKSIANSPKKLKAKPKEDDFSDDNNNFQEERFYNTIPSIKQEFYDDNEENNFENYSTPQHLNKNKLDSALNEPPVRYSTMESSHHYKSPGKGISTDSENSPKHVPHSPFDVSYNSPNQSPVRPKRNPKTAGNLMKRKKSPKSKKKSAKKKDHIQKQEKFSKNSEDEEYDFNNKEERKLTDLDIQNIKSGWTAPTINSSSSSPLQNISSSNRLVSNYDDNQSPKRQSFEELRSSDNDESGHDNKLISFTNVNEDQQENQPQVKRNEDFDLISFSPMRPSRNHGDDLIVFSDKSFDKDEKRRVPKSPISKNHDDQLLSNHEFLINANSDVSNDDNSSIKDKNVSKSDLLQFSEFEVKTSPKGKPDLDIINQIINNNSNFEKETVIPNENNQNEDHLISFSVIQNNPNEENNGNESEFEKSEIILSSSALSPTKFNQNEYNDNQFNGDILNQNEYNDNQINEDILNHNNENKNEIENKGEIDNQEEGDNQNDVIIDVIQNVEIQKEEINADNNQTNSDNSNFISFSSIHNDDIPQNVKPSLMIPENPIPIEIIPIDDANDPNILPAEQMDLAVFESPIKKPTGNQDDKYRLNSSEIQNHLFESSGEPSILNTEKVQNDISSLSEHLEKEQNSSPNQAQGSRFNEYNEKADSDVIDSPEKGYFNDIFKSPNNIHYNKLAIYSEGLSPKSKSPYLLSNKNPNDSTSSHTMNSTSFLSSPYKRTRRQPKTAMAMINRHFSQIEEEDSSEQYRSSFSTLKSQSPPKGKTHNEETNESTIEPKEETIKNDNDDTTFNEEDNIKNSTTLNEDNNMKNDTTLNEEDNMKNDTTLNDDDNIKNDTTFTEEEIVKTEVENIKTENDNTTFNDESNQEIIEEEEIPDEKLESNNGNELLNLNAIPTIPTKPNDIDFNTKFENDEMLNESKYSNDYSRFENDSEIRNQQEEKSEISPEIQEAIDSHNFTPNVIRSLVHSIVGVPLYDNSNQNLSLANNRNSSIIEIEDRIFEFQERLCTVIEVELKKDNGEVINIFPTNLNTIHNQSSKANKSKESNKTEKGKTVNRPKSPSQISKLPRSRSPNRSFNSPFKSATIRNKSVEKISPSSPGSPAIKSTDKRSPSPISKIPKFPDAMSSSKRHSLLKSPLKNPKKRHSTEPNNEADTIDYDKQFHTMEPNLDEFVSVSTPSKSIFNDNKKEESNDDDFIPVSTPTKKTHTKPVSSIPTSPSRNKKSTKKNSLIGNKTKKEEPPIEFTIAKSDDEIEENQNENNSDDEKDNNNSSAINESTHSENENKFDSDEFVSVSTHSTPQTNSVKSKPKKQPKNELSQDKIKSSKPPIQPKSTKTKPVVGISSPARNKPANSNVAASNPFLKGKGNGPQFSLRKPLKRAIPSTTKKPQQEKETNNDDTTIDNDSEINEIIQFPTGGTKEEKPTLANRNKKTPSVKSSSSKPNPPAPNNTNKTGMNNKKIQLQSPKSIEDPFKALKAQNNKKKNTGSTIKQQPATAAKKKKTLASNTTTQKSTNNQKSSTKTEKPKEDNTSSSAFKNPFNIDMSMFADANQPKQQFNMQSSPSRKPRSLASVLIAADDYSDDNYD